MPSPLLQQAPAAWPHFEDSAVQALVEVARESLGVLAISTHPHGPRLTADLERALRRVEGRVEPSPDRQELVRKAFAPGYVGSVF